ncbi:Z-DNA-binding protein 1 isoform a [Homo sapiens]|uniref:Z-DNA-binding protein 1 n=1 Tax=Homo sapiens TaxID=9606 RepID=ZBP1_HUMAN|nr:Z-DNA-binding protein 1 isoform a [Homo sapiens]Q9H171.2 RecName: Full=Z-DNA-binding protein 1; AltName: Full=DNA-dependent activator of IFN-regulatory factors; Short=DAI; AltName: Full=Tumor stroma and activated macrophage protein DLM-1 [Homo sapiens]|eukprot:NP_110403.2 Z-DNA-binding protein 1 isoform a [Homo sapiens]
MAQAPADPGREGHLEQRILQVLTEAGSPVKLAQLVKECQAPKRELNQVLYRMKKELKVSLTSPATWCLGGTDPEGEGPAELALSSPAERPQQHAATIPETPGPQFSQQREEDIYRFLKDNGPQRALVIAQALGMRTAKDVNRDLYRMKSRHLLDMDEQSKAWTIYRPEDSGRRAKSASIIYQHNPINMICQNGPNSWISIANSEAIQIGHGNIITRQTVSREDGSAGPRHLPSMAPGDSSTWGTLVDPWGPQDIHMEQSILRRVQLGHSNEMRLHGVPSEGPAHIPPGSPPVSATAAGPEASFEARIPSPGTHPEGEAAQRIHMKSCFLEDATIGNSNKMSISPGVAGPGGVAGSGEGEPGEDAGRRPADTQSRSHFPRDIGQPITPSHSKLTPKLETMTLGNRSHKAAEGSHYVDEASHEGSWWGGGI